MQCAQKINVEVERQPFLIIMESLSVTFTPKEHQLRQSDVELSQHEPESQSCVKKQI